MVSKVFDSIGEWVIDDLKMRGECIKTWVCTVLSTNQCEKFVIKNHDGDMHSTRKKVKITMKRT